MPTIAGIGLAVAINYLRSPGNLVIAVDKYLRDTPPSFDMTKMFRNMDKLESVLYPDPAPGSKLATFGIDILPTKLKSKDGSTNTMSMILTSLFTVLV